MDTGKATWDSCGTNHGTLASVHGAKHFNVGVYHVWHMHTYGMTMVLIDFKFSHHHGHLWCIHRLYLGNL
jgi:hypothetical protein